MCKNCGKIAILLVPEQPFCTKWGSIVKNWGKIAILLVPGLSWSNPFARNEGRSSIVKNGGKIAILLVPDLSWSNPFARNEGRCAKTAIKLRFYLCRTCPGATFSRDLQGRSVKNWGKTAIFLVLDQFFRTKWRSIVKNWRKICDFSSPGPTLSHDLRVDFQNLRSILSEVWLVPEQLPFARCLGSMYNNRT